MNDEVEVYFKDGEENVWLGAFKNLTLAEIFTNALEEKDPDKYENKLCFVF